MSIEDDRTLLPVFPAFLSPLPLVAAALLTVDLDTPMVRLATLSTLTVLFVRPRLVVRGSGLLAFTDVVFFAAGAFGGSVLDAADVVLSLLPRVPVALELAFFADAPDSFFATDTCDTAGGAGW